MSDTVNVAPQGEVRVKSRRGRRALALILAILVILLGLASYLLFRLVTPPGGAVSGDDAAGVTWVRSIYGTGESPDEQFRHTNSAGTSPDGTVWIVDSVRSALMGFTPDGRYIRSVTGDEEMPLIAPSRFAVGPDGRFYVCETNSDVVRVLDTDGKEAGSFGIPKPTSVAVGEDRIVVGTVQGFAILDMEGKPLHVIGERGKEEGKFDYVHGVAIGDDGNVYVVDSFNNRLSAYTMEGERLWIVRSGLPSNAADMADGRLGVPDDAAHDTTETVPVVDSGLQLPLGLTIDGAGRLVTVDMFGSMLAVFDPKDGSFIGTYGDVGAQDGQFFYPQSIAYDKQRDLFIVSDSLNDRVQLIRIPGSAGGGDAAAAVRRALDGPLRACLLPLALLVIAAIVWIVSRRRKERAASRAAATPQVGATESQAPAEV